MVKISNSNENDGLVSVLASSSDYDTLQANLDRATIVCTRVIKSKNKDPMQLKSEYKKIRNFCGFLKFTLDYHGGYLGFLWL